MNCRKNRRFDTINASITVTVPVPAIILILVAVIAVATTTIRRRIYTPPLRIHPGTARPEESFKQLDQWLQSLYKSKRFNGSVLIADADNILFNKSYGSNRADPPQSLTEHSSFNLASVSKQFTAMAILLLEHRGQLSVTDALIDHIPELTDYPEVTIENLLHHTSGLADYMMLAVKQNADKDLFKTSDLIRLFTTRKPSLHFQPGSKFSYSNTGYVLLAEIVTRASGQTFESFLSENIFRPAGMSNSQAFNLLSTEQPANRVYGFKYRRFTRNNTTAHDLNNFDGVSGDGGVYASAHDLFRWHQALHNALLLPHSAYNRATTPGQLTDGSNTDYGYGWFLRSPTTIEHAGGWVGFSSYVYRDLSSGRLIVILDNSTNAPRVVAKGFRINSIAINLIRFIGNI